MVFLEFERRETWQDIAMIWMMTAATTRGNNLVVKGPGTTTIPTTLAIGRWVTLDPMIMVAAGLASELIISMTNRGLSANAEDIAMKTISGRHMIDQGTIHHVGPANTSEVPVQDSVAVTS